MSYRIIKKVNTPANNRSILILLNTCFLELSFIGIFLNLNYILMKTKRLSFKKNKNYLLPFFCLTIISITTVSNSASPPERLIFPPVKQAFLPFFHPASAERNSTARSRQGDGLLNLRHRSRRSLRAVDE